MVTPKKTGAVTNGNKVKICSFVTMRAMTGKAFSHW